MKKLLIIVLFYTIGLTLQTRLDAENTAESICEGCEKVHKSVQMKKQALSTAHENLSNAQANVRAAQIAYNTALADYHQCCVQSITKETHRLKR